MFEKEAEEYYYKTYPVTLNIGEEERKKKVTDIFIKCAEFGFQKGIKAKINTTTISDCPIKNQWHYVEDGDLPKKSISVFAYFKGDISLTECLYIPDEGFKHPIFSEWYEPTAWIEKEKIFPEEIE